MIKLFFEFTEQTRKRKQMVKFFRLIQNRLKIINFNNVKIKPPNKDAIQHLYLMAYCCWICKSQRKRLYTTSSI